MPIDLDIAAHRTRIGDTQRRAPSAEIAKLDAEIEDVERQYQRALLDEDALHLLNALFREHGENRKANIAGPVLDIVRPWANRIIGRPLDAVTFNATFAAGQLRLDGMPEHVDWDAMSFGTGDQLAVLIRMAFAKLLAEHAAHGPFPLVLDDPLVHSDMVRLPKMLKLIEELSRELQVIVFTCRQSDYAGADAALTSIMPAGSAATPTMAARHE